MSFSHSTPSSSSSSSEPLHTFLTYYTSTFCTFNLSISQLPDANQTLLITISSLLDPILTCHTHAILPSSSHIMLDIFPSAYTPLEYKTHAISHPSPPSITHKSQHKPHKTHNNNNTLIFSISNTGKIMCKDILNITDNILQTIPHKPILLRPLHEISTEIHTLLVNTYAIDTQHELDHIIDRASYIRNFYHILGQITAQFIQLSLLYQDSAYLLDNATYFLDSEPYKNAFLQAKFALEKYIYFYHKLSNFNQSISSILLESPHKPSRFISHINKLITQFTLKLKRLTYLYSHFISNPYLIKKYITSPSKHAHLPLIHQKTVTFKTLHKFLSHNIDHATHAPLLSSLLSAHRRMTSNLYFLYRYLP